MRVILFAIFLTYASMVAAQVTGPGGRVTYQTERPAFSSVPLKQTLTDIIHDVISTRVDAQFSKGSPKESRRCIDACNRYQAAASQMRQELTIDGIFTEATHKEFKEAGQAYIFASRDFRAAQKNPDRPYVPASGHQKIKNKAMGER